MAENKKPTTTKKPAAKKPAAPKLTDDKVAKYLEGVQRRGITTDERKSVTAVIKLLTS